MSRCCGRRLGQVVQLGNRIQGFRGCCKMAPKERLGGPVGTARIWLLQGVAARILESVTALTPSLSQGGLTELARL